MEMLTQFHGVYFNTPVGPGMSLHNFFVKKPRK